jgi:hypothetical protein
MTKDTIQVQVSHITPVNIGNDTTICENLTISFNAGNSYSSFLWSNGTASQTSNYSGSLGAGIHPIYVNVFNSLGCISTDTLQLTINANPIVNIGNDSLLCGISNMLLNAGSGGINYLWSTGNTSQFQLINGAAFTPGTYLFNVLVTGANNCKSSDTIAITFSHILDIEMGLDTAICKTQILNLNAGSGYLSYVWSNGSSSQSIVIDSLIGLGPHLFHVRANDAFGCWAMDTIVVTINPCLDIQENENKEEINIFPNPSNGIFYIQAQNIETIEVSDVSGKIVRRIKNLNADNGIIKIDLGKLEKGVYLLKLYHQKSVSTKNIIVQ